MPLVSICIPTYNQTKYLRKVLDSVFEQTFTDYEVIVSDDSTTSDVKELIDEYIAQGKEIRYFHHSPALGSPENWNFAMNQAQGEYIKILHHDDWFSKKESLYKFVNLLKDGSVFGFSNSIVEFENNKKYIHDCLELDLNKFIKKPEKLFLGNLIGSPSAVIFKKDINIRFDKNLIWIVDIDFYYRLLKKNNNISYTQECLIVTFGPEERITSQCFNNKTIEISEYFYVLNKYFYYDKNFFSFLFLKCSQYSISNISDIYTAGYVGRISLIFKILFYIKNLKIYNTYRRLYLNKFKNTNSKEHEISSTRLINSKINFSTKIESNCEIVNSVFGLYNRVGKDSYLYNVSMDDYTYTSIRSTIQNTKIGKFCSIAQDVSIGLGMQPSIKFVSSHPLFYSRHKQCGISFADKSYFKENGKVIIGNDVWIGAKAIIFDDVKIGNGAIIAANSVVKEDVPDFAIVGGTPAKILSYRFTPEQIMWLQNFKWWEKEESWIKDNFKKFHNIEDFIREYS